MTNLQRLIAEAATESGRYYRAHRVQDDPHVFFNLAQHDCLFCNLGIAHDGEQCAAAQLATREVH